MARNRLVSLGLLFGLAFAGCKQTRGGGEIGGLRDALVSGDAAALARATEGAPRCVVDAASRAGAGAPDACLGAIATWLGSKTGFQRDPPDQAGAATAALLLVREGHGEWLPAPEAWLFAVKTGKGAGADALRLAMASRMATAIPPLGRALEGDGDARALMGAVAGSVPGACDTYERLGSGEEVAAGPPERTADHSPCVQKDLERASGPREHGRYGAGLWRGAEGALALWREAAAALRGGLGHADGAVAEAMKARLYVIDAGLAKVETKKMAPLPDYSAFMSDVHAGVLDAGAGVAPGGVPAAGVPAAGGGKRGK